jgi:hypothetical protein
VVEGELLALLPGRGRLHGELAHGGCVLVDPGPVEGGLDQPAV